MNIIQSISKNFVDGIYIHKTADIQIRVEGNSATCIRARGAKNWTEGEVVNLVNLDVNDWTQIG
jgi:hypothetical protein